MTSDRINVKQYYISVFTYVARTRNTKTKTHVDTNTRTHVYVVYVLHVPMVHK